MKLAAQDVARFLRSPDPGLRAVLVYGPDQGLVRERALVLAAHVVDDLADPFRVGELTGDILASDPARLADESAAQSLIGGRRVVMVRDAGDRLGGLFAGFLKGAPGDSLVVVEAGDLGAGSSLRKAFETAANGVALPCYADTSAALQTLVNEMLGGAGLRADADALAYLRGALGGDRMVSRSEVEKLILYKGEGGGTVSLADARACVGDTAGEDLGELALATGGGNLAELDRRLDRCFLGGESPVTVLRVVASHLQRLQLVLAQRDLGLDAAMNRLRPKVFFKQAPAFKTQLGQWSEDRLGEALQIVTEAELDCKTTGLPAEVVCRQALLRISRAARRGAPGR